MGTAPGMLQIAEDDSLIMVFVPTAIHPFTGYLAFVGESKVHRVKLRPEEAMKLEFSAGLYRPPQGMAGRRLSRQPGVVSSNATSGLAT